MADDVRIDPWSSAQSTDYQRIIDQFGLQTFQQGSVQNPNCLLYTSPSPRDVEESRMPSSA